MGLKCVGPLRGKCFSIVNTTYSPTQLELVESMDAEPQMWRKCGYLGLAKNYIPISNCMMGQFPLPLLVQGSTVYP